MSESLKGLQVLLIEDEPDIAELLHFILFQNGAAVTVATTALEGLLVLNEQQPQVLVCNLLAAGHGWEAAHPAGTVVARCNCQPSASDCRHLV